MPNKKFEITHDELDEIFIGVPQKLSLPAFISRRARPAQIPLKPKFPFLKGRK